MSQIASFPFPFRSDTFRYTTNVEPARVRVITEAGSWGTHLFHNDCEYLPELAMRRSILDSDPSRHTVLPHMRSAAWDALLVVLTELAASDPVRLRLKREGPRWRWQNDLLGSDVSFVFGREETLPCPPLMFAGSQVQDDLVLLDQREDVLWADGGLVTFAADWSLGFDVGMTFMDLHSPVAPAVHQSQVISRAHEVLLRLQAGAELRRSNWSVTVGRHLDMSTEQHPVWAPQRARVLDSDFGSTLHLRTELQHVIRLPTSGAILFTIRTYHLSLDELAQVPSWLQRFTRVITELPADLVAAKSMQTYRPALVQWLAEAAATG